MKMMKMMDHPKFKHTLELITWSLYQGPSPHPHLLPGLGLSTSSVGDLLLAFNSVLDFVSPLQQKNELNPKQFPFFADLTHPSLTTMKAGRTNEAERHCLLGSLQGQSVHLLDGWIQG